MVDPSLHPLIQRLDQNPDDQETLATLWKRLLEAKQFQVLATLAEKLAARRKQPASAADLFQRAGELWFSQVGRTDKALACYERALELDPNAPRALESAREIYLHQRRYDRAIPLL